MATVYYRKENGSYYQRVETDYTAQEGVNMTVTPMEVEILRDNLPVNGTWSGTTVQNYTYDVGGNFMSMTYNDTFTIMEKGVSVTVGNTTYNDVIKVKHVQNTRMQIAGFPINQTAQYTIYNWYAKDVGMIKTEGASSQTGGDTYLHLTSYTLN